MQAAPPPVDEATALSEAAIAVLREHLAESTIGRGEGESETDSMLVATPAPVTIAARETAARATAQPKTGPRLVVIRGLKESVEYRVCEGKNYVGRTADRPADIDLTGQEPSDQVWSSRQHAVIICIRGSLQIEDLNSLNGTFVNRTRLASGQRKELQAGDVIAIGTVHLKVEV
jgi:pSer/pThr/pTyr-binding forkhead associated (FHA) protein